MKTWVVIKATAEAVKMGDREFLDYMLYNGKNSVLVAKDKATALKIVEQIKTGTYGKEVC